MPVIKENDIVSNDRYSLVLELRQRGETYAEIGKKLELTRERVRQLLREAECARESAEKAAELKRLCLELVPSGRPPETILEMDIAGLGIRKKRILTAFKHHNIRTVGELLSTPRPEIAKLRNLGRGSLKAIEAALAYCGLSLPRDAAAADDRNNTLERSPDNEPLRNFCKLLNTRARLCLKRKSFETPEQIRDAGPRELLKMRNLGPDTLKDIANALERAGLIESAEKWANPPAHSMPRKNSACLRYEPTPCDPADSP